MPAPALPRRPDWAIARPRLAERIPGHDIVLVSGTAGAGKTFAILDILESLGDTTAPVMLDLLDILDADAAWHRIVDRVAPCLEGAPDAADPRRYEIDGLAAAQPLDGRPLTVVVDSLESSVLDGLTTRLSALARQPWAARLVVGARGGLQFGRMAELSHDLLLLDQVELSLTPDETLALLRSEGLAAPQSLAERIVAAARGLPLGIRTVVLEMKRDPVRVASASDEELESLAFRDIRRYLGARLLEGASREQREMIERLRLVGTVPVPLAAALLGDQAPYVLSVLADRGVGQWRESADHLEFAFFGPLRGTIFAGALTDDERDAVHRTAATWFADDGDVARALDHATRTGDSGFVIDTVGRLGAFTVAGTSTDLEPFLSRLSSGELASQPLLALLLADAHLRRPDAVGAALSWYRIAAEGAERAEPSMPLVKAFALRTSGEHEEAAALLDEVIAHGSAESEPWFEDYHRFARIQRALSDTFAGTGDLGEGALAVALELPGTHSGHHELGEVRLAAIRAMRGELMAARHFLDSTPDHVLARLDAHRFHGMWLTLVRANALVEQGDPARAFELLVARQDDIAADETWPLFASTLGLAAGVEGRRAPETWGTLAAWWIEPRIDPSPMWKSSLLTTQALLSMARGREIAAHELLERARAFGAGPDHATSLARMLLLGRRAEDALTALAGVPRSAGPRAAARARLLRFAALRALDRSDEARDALEAAGTTMAREGLISPILALTARERGEALEAATGLDPRIGRELARAAETCPAFFDDSRALVTLTDSEWAVLTGLGSGATLKEISAERVVSINTVRTQARSLYRKLGAGNRDEALTAAAALGFGISADGSGRGRE